MCDIHLHNFISCARPGIADIEAHHDLAIALELLSARSQIGIAKRCIAQTITERIERLLAKIHVGATMPDVIVHYGRQLVERHRPRHH